MAGSQVFSERPSNWEHLSGLWGWSYGYLSSSTSGPHLTLRNIGTLKYRQVFLKPMVFEASFWYNWNIFLQDYHRFHSPVTGRILRVDDVPGMLYTVIHHIYVGLRMPFFPTYAVTEHCDIWIWCRSWAYNIVKTNLYFDYSADVNIIIYWFIYVFDLFSGIERWL